MNKLRFYQISTGVLLLLNVALLIFLVLNRPHHNNSGNALEILKFDHNQHSNFELSVKKHKAKMHASKEEKKKVLKEYFSLLLKENQVDKIDSLLEDIKRIELVKVQSTYHHFEEIKNMLNEEQLKSYPAFIDHALGRILEGKRKGPKSKSKK